MPVLSSKGKDKNHPAEHRRGGKSLLWIDTSEKRGAYYTGQRTVYLSPGFYQQKGERDYTRLFRYARGETKKTLRNILLK